MPRALLSRRVPLYQRRAASVHYLTIFHQEKVLHYEDNLSYWEQVLTALARMGRVAGQEKSRRHKGRVQRGAPMNSCCPGRRSLVGVSSPNRPHHHPLSTRPTQHRRQPILPDGGGGGYHLSMRSGSGVRARAVAVKVSTGLCTRGSQATTEEWIRFYTPSNV
ncbi:unnamed protein product, partial [Nezara viridula]